MPRGKAKSRWDYNKKKGCKYENNTWCDLPKYKRCADCIRLMGGEKACEVKL